MSLVIPLQRHHLSDEIAASSLHEVVEDLAQRLAATAVERDRAGGHAARERELIRQSGLLTLTIPTVHGGEGGDWSSMYRTLRRLAEVDSALAHLFGFHHLQLAGVRLYGTPEQQASARKHKSLADLPRGAKVGIQNDPSNSGRALALLQKYGVLKLKPGAGISATVADVVENPKQLQLLQIEAAQLPRSLDDLDASAINTNYAVQARLVPTRDAIAIEEVRSPYANLLVVRTADKDKPWVGTLVKAFQSPEVKAFVQANFSGSVVPAF